MRRECADYVIDSQHTRPLFDALGVCRLQLMELGFEVENYTELPVVLEIGSGMGETTLAMAAAGSRRRPTSNAAVTKRSIRVMGRG